MESVPRDFPSTVRIFVRKLGSWAYDWQCDLRRCKAGIRIWQLQYKMVAIMSVTRSKLLRCSSLRRYFQSCLHYRW